MAKNEELMKLINEIRVHSNLNQSEIATAIGVSKQYLSDTVNGRFPFSDELRNKLYVQFTYLNQPSDVSPGGIPLYEADFALGFLSFPDSAVHPARYVTFPGTENATCWCRATGDSMRPMIDNGDYVCLRRIEDTSLLFYGEVYAIDCTNDMRTIKKIGRGSTPDVLRLTPVNPEYDEQELPLSLVRNIFAVVAVTKFL